MKFFIYSIFSLIFITNEIINAAGIHPIHVQTVPLGTRPSSTLSNKPIPTADTPWPTRHSRQSFSTSETTSMSKTTDDNHHHDDHHHHHNSGVCSNRSNCIEATIAIIILSIVLIFVAFAVKSSCCNKKTKNNTKPLTNKCRRLVVENKVYISTISGKREEAPPAYADVHRV